MIVESIPVSPTELQTDGVRYASLTDADWRALLQYLQRCAWSLFNRPGHEVPLGEFEDAGMEALCSALEQARVPNETLWLGFARHVIYQQMRWRRRRYHQWRFPVAGLSWKPPAEVLTPIDSAAVAREAEAALWLRQVLQDHARCLSPVRRQALEDFLADVPIPERCARDGITRTHASHRQRDLLDFLHDHLVEEETSCWEVQHPAQASHKRDSRATKLAKKHLRYQRWRGRQRAKEGSHAAAD